MPLNYLEIHNQVLSMGQHTHQRMHELEQKRKTALKFFTDFKDQLEPIRDRIQKAQLKNPSLRCAIPGSSPLTTAFQTVPITEDMITLAADGSQINPNFHDPVPFGVINVGAFRMASPRLNQPPLEKVSSRLLLDEIYSAGFLMSEEILALRRDLDERSFLAELSSLETLPVVSLTDGPLELFRDPKDRPEFKSLLNDYLKALEDLAAQKTITAGYVDRPRSDLVVRCLELMILPENEFHQAGKIHPLAGVTDSDLFQTILGPGERSGVFAIQSPSAEVFIGELTITFFYMNSGTADNPSIARVEIPAWVADDPGLLSMLHACLIEQCLMLGSHPYPYALHRAHEVAVVHFNEKEEITRMITQALNQQGLFVAGPSNKQIHKNESGMKMRYKK